MKMGEDVSMVKRPVGEGDEAITPKELADMKKEMLRLKQETRS